MEGSLRYQGRPKSPDGLFCTKPIDQEFSMSPQDSSASRNNGTGSGDLTVSLSPSPKRPIYTIACNLNDYGRVAGNAFKTESRRIKSKSSKFKQVLKFLAVSKRMVRSSTMDICLM
jgi:hypothetical protein